MVPMTLSADNRPAAHAAELDRLAADINGLTERFRGDAEALLGLLRLLEQLHRDIQDGAFRQSLPTDRQALYTLLREMEVAGGWPYIPRLQLRTFLELLESENSNQPKAS